MPDIAEILRAGGNGWIYLPFAVLLGALHGLEPGHSKTMMAAYIVAIRGTVGQAVLLGVCAALSHSLIVWAVAMVGLTLGREILTTHFEAWLLIASGVIILGIATWMLWRTGQSLGWFSRRRLHAHGHHHGHEHSRSHAHHHGHEHADSHPHYGQEYSHSHDLHDHAHHHDEVRRIDTGHGVIELSVFENGVPPRWRIRTVSGEAWSAQGVSVETERPDGSRQTFGFIDHGDYMESVDEIPEPHELKARVLLSHRGHVHTYNVSFAEHDHHDHDQKHHDHHGHDHHGHDHRPHDHGHYEEDAHEREHAGQIARQFAANGSQVTTSQIALFGITGGLIPCPASITVLLICLQLGQFTLGVATVAAFSLGLAITMVAIGVTAAWGVHHASKRITLSDRVLRRLPLASAGLVASLGLVMLVQGFNDLLVPATALS